MTSPAQPSDPSTLFIPATTELAFDKDAQNIAKRQYLQPGDETISGMFARIANWVARAEDPKDRLAWAQKFYDLMAEKKFCPGGRVIAGAGTQHGNVLNCFVQGATANDPASFDGVMEIAMKLALVTKVGGGNGVNLDVFARQDDRAARPVTATAFLKATHPDILTFIQLKATPSNQPDGEKVPVTLRHFERAVYGTEDEIKALNDLEGGDYLRRMGVGTYVEGSDYSSDFSMVGGLISVPDDLAGIVNAARQMLLDSRSAAAHPEESGDIWIDLSAMRPENTPIKGSGGTSSGPVSFLVEIFDNFLAWEARGGEKSGPINTLRYIFAPVLRVVRQGGTRRGAGMATISATNPHILDFITCKDLDREADEGDISTFNISILVSDTFKNQVDRNEWISTETGEEIVGVPGKYDLSTLSDVRGAQVRAGFLWREIAQHAWATGEPGLIFIDRVNEYSALKHMGEAYQIRSTNPCFHPDTPVLTRAEGTIDLQPIADLAERTVFVWTGTMWQETTFRKTRENAELLTLKLTNGVVIRATPDHTFILQSGERAALKDLTAGQTLRRGMSAHHLDQALERHGSRHHPATEQGDFMVLSVTDEGERSDVYCCTVDGEHSFTLGSGLLVGNCGEIPLTVGEPCDLGAINLSAYVHDGAFDFDTFRTDVQTCVRFLDDVLDVNVFALEDNRKASHDLRRLGLGIMGLADALIRLGLPYNSDRGLDMTSEIIRVMREEAVKTSEALGEERGNYPLYERTVSDPATQNLIPHRPRRNVAVLTVAPTGTTSMLMGVSSGIEPIFAPFIWRKIGSEYVALIAPLFLDMLSAHLQGLGEDERSALRARDLVTGEGEDTRWNTDVLTAAISANHGSVVGLDFIPEDMQRLLLCAHDLNPTDHVRMQGTIQRAFDDGGALAANALSKTINLSNGATMEDIQQAYDLAYSTGCKGITVYRDGSRQFQVLNTSKNDDKGVLEAVRLELTARGLNPELAREDHLQAYPDMDAAVIALIIERDHYRNLASARSDEIAEMHARLNAMEASGEEGNLNRPATPRFTRERELTGRTMQTKLTDMTTGQRTSYLITVNTDEDTGLPIEVLVIGGNSGQEAHADSEALGRVVSNALQYGIPAKVIIKTLENINGGLMGNLELGGKTRMVNSKASLIAAALENALKRRAPRQDTDTSAAPDVDVRTTEPSVAPASAPESVKASNTPGINAERCPSCEEMTLVREEGCRTCRACGYSKCG